LPSSKGEKLCPICDSPLKPGSKKCGFCGTDLTIFDMEVDSAPAPAKPETPAEEPVIEVEIEDNVDDVFFGGAREETSEAPETMEEEAPAEAVTEVEEEVRPEPESAEPVPEEQPAEPEPVAREETFECPECGSPVSVSASSCPSCGVIFAEEGAELFQCPACDTLVSIDAKACPGCGAMFVDPDEAAPEEAVPTEDIVSDAESVKETPAIEEPVTVVEAEPKVVVAEEGPSVEPEEPSSKDKGKLFGWLGRKKRKDEPESLEAEEGPSEAESIEPPVRRVASPVQHAPEVREIPSGREAKDKGKELARVRAEIKPLLALAIQKEVDIAESKRLIDEALSAGRERKLDEAIEKLQVSKALLTDNLKTNLVELLEQLKEEMEVASDLGGDVSRPKTYLKEVERARESDDIEAAYVYAEKAKKEMLPITGRYNETKKKVDNLRQLISDSELLFVDTRDGRAKLVEATRAFEQRDFDRVDLAVKEARGLLEKEIPARMSEEIKKAKVQLVEAKEKGANITPMLTQLKTAISLMKSSDYGQALKEMREFKDMMKKAK
jgi:hypothetical protein